jgi:hypothetical protein
MLQKRLHHGIISSLKGYEALLHCQDNLVLLMFAVQRVHQCWLLTENHLLSFNTSSITLILGNNSNKSISNEVKHFE